MPQWLTNLLPEGMPSWWLVVGAAVLTVGTFIGSIAITAWAVIRIPADYFRGEDAPNAWRDHHVVFRWAMHIGKNLFGVFLIILGIVMSIPGVPGQGILTILLGVMLVDFPGKRRCEQWLVSRRRVRNSINRIRAKFGRPPLVLD